MTFFHYTYNRKSTVFFFETEKNTIVPPMSQKSVNSHLQLFFSSLLYFRAYFIFLSISFIICFYYYLKKVVFWIAQLNLKKTEVRMWEGLVQQMSGSEVQQKIFSLLRICKKGHNLLIHDNRQSKNQDKSTTGKKIATQVFIFWQ